jgi:immune inhibitor A
MGGSTSRTAEHFYMAEYRTYTGYDANLQTGPYNFGWLNTQPNLVEKFPFQDGLVVWYVNYAFEDNNTSAHPGGGLTLPVDSRPAPVAWPGCSVAPNPGAGNPNGLCKLGNRRQPFDAVFGTQATDAVTFHRNGVALTVPSSPAITTFTDTNPNAYWSAANPWSSVKVAGDGVTIMVVSENLDDPAHPVMVVKVTN